MTSTLIATGRRVRTAYIPSVPAWSYLRLVDGPRGTLQVETRSFPGKYMPLAGEVLEPERFTAGAR